MKINIGDTVRYSSEFLHNTGQYFGDIPRAKGVVTGLEKIGKHYLVSIDWDFPNIPPRVLSCNLEK